MLNRPLFQRRVLPILMLGLSLAGPFAFSQQPSVPSKPDQQPAGSNPSSSQSSGQSSDESQKPTETLRINVNVVQLFFNVKDKRGALVPNLTKDDFEIAEDGKPQTIKYFSAESNLPLTIG